MASISYREEHQGVKPKGHDTPISRTAHPSKSGAPDRQTPRSFFFMSFAVTRNDVRNSPPCCADSGVWPYTYMGGGIMGLELQMIRLFYIFVQREELVRIECWPLSPCQGWNKASSHSTVPEFIYPRFRENKPKTLVFSHRKRAF